MIVVTNISFASWAHICVYLDMHTHACCYVSRANVCMCTARLHSSRDFRLSRAYTPLAHMFLKNIYSAKEHVYTKLHMFVRAYALETLGSLDGCLVVPAYTQLSCCVLFLHRCLHCEQQCIKMCLDICSIHARTRACWMLPM